MAAFTSASLSRSGLKKGLVACAALMLLGAPAASARDDGGVLEFMQQQFGIGQPAEPAAPEPYGVQSPGVERSLTIRAHRKRASVPRAVRVATVQKPSGPVTIYDDPTLRPGDAVMTEKGMRIFQGGRAMPYNDSNFVALTSVKLPQNVGKILLALDRAPRD